MRTGFSMRMQGTKIVNSFNLPELTEPLNPTDRAREKYSRAEDDELARSFIQFLRIVRQLRKECPWDREQTHESLRPMLIEEAYETVEAIDSRDYTELKKELGDLLLHILFHSELGAESGNFTLFDVFEAERSKLIYRHPHVFGAVEVADADQVSRNWEQLKRRESGRTSVLDGVPASLPALQRASRIQEKASKVGFDWTESTSVWKKIREELDEFERETSPERRIDEFGDILFSLVNLARHEKLDAEGALRQATNKFDRRFRLVEQEVEGSGKPLNSFSLEELDKIWDRVKLAEKKEH
jgi:tetrapyrrole methylase family protein / MazG family protein